MADFIPGKSSQELAAESQALRQRANESLQIWKNGISNLRGSSLMNQADSQDGGASLSGSQTRNAHAGGRTRE